ncbi:MAG: dUTP diphosphatase [Campylobacterales bacterium]
MYSKEEQCLKEMLEMQESLNIYTNGADYKDTKKCAKTGKPINYRRCAWMETAEFVDSFDWKHWKHGKDDIENAKTELVDIWHFLMSAELMENRDINDDTLKMTVEIITASKTMSKEANIYALAEFLVKDLLNHEVSIFPRESRGEILRTFFELCHLTGLGFDELYQRYIVKNTLNKFRQDNGYTDGSYIKIWHNGKEDNAFAVMFADAINELNKDNLYSAMDYFYSSIVKPHNGSFNGDLNMLGKSIKEHIGVNLELSLKG